MGRGANRRNRAAFNGGSVVGPNDQQVQQMMAMASQREMQQQAVMNHLLELRLQTANAIMASLVTRTFPLDSDEELETKVEHAYKVADRMMAGTGIHLQVGPRPDDNGQQDEGTDNPATDEE